MSNNTAVHERIEKRIKELRLLKDDWDSEGAKAPSEMNLMSMDQFLYFLTRFGLQEPSRIVTGPCGEVVAEWQDEDIVFEVEFSGVAQLSWCA